MSGRAELVGVHHAGVDVDVLDLRQDHAQVLVRAQHVADGRGDLALREDARRHLVQQGLEEMVVGAIDERDANGLPLEGSHGEKATEPAPDDHDVMAPLGRGVHGHSLRSTTVWT